MAAIPPTARIADTCLDGRVVVGVLSSYALTSLTLGAGGQAKVKRGIAIPATGGMDDDAAVVVPPGTRIAVKLIRKWKMGFEPPTLSIRPGAFSGSVPRKLAELVRGALSFVFCFPWKNTEFAPQYAEHRCLEVLQSTTFHPNIVRHYETVWDVQLRKKPSVRTRI